jgi:hypothetical protein
MKRNLVNVGPLWGVAVGTRPEAALFETAYERVTEIPKVGKINAYRRRDWMP